MGSGNKNAGLIGGVLVAIGVILTVIFPPLGVAWGAAVGPYLVAAGTLLNIGAALTARTPSIRRAENSPTYAIDTFNPRGPDSYVPIAFGTGEDSPRVVGAIIAQGVLSMGETPSPGVDLVREQGLRMVLAMAEGPVKEIRDVQFDGNPIFSETITDTFTGNGSRKEFVLSSPYAHVPRLVVTVAGTQVFNTKTAVTGQRLVFPPTTSSAPNVVEVVVNKKEKIIGGSFKVYRNGTEVRRTGGSLTWASARISDRRYRLTFNLRPPDSDVVTVSFDKVAYQDVYFFQNGKGRTTLFFGASRVPASGAAVVATYVRENFPGVKIAWTNGAVDQDGIPGLDQVVDSQNPDGNRTLQKETPISVTTKKEADDLRVGLIAPFGFKHYKDDGSEDAVSVKIAITYRKVTGSSLGPVKTLRTLGAEDAPKSVFTLAGLRSGRVSWEVSFRRELEALAAAGDDDAVADLEDFTRSIYKVSVERKTKVRQDKDATYLDTVDFAYVTTVEDVSFRLPGTACLFVSARVGAALGNATPVVSAVVDRGDIHDPRTGGTGSSSNPALAIFNLVTSDRGAARQRYGGGEWFTEDDFAPLTGLGSIGAFADWCDEWIDPETGADSTEEAGGIRRARLSLVIDSPGSLLEWVSDMAAAARAFAVLQGVRWRFPIDEDGDPVYAFRESRSATLSSNIRAGTLAQGPDSFAKEPTEILCQFWNRDLDGNRDEVLVYRKDLAADAPRVTSRISVIGETRPAAIVLLARHLLAASQGGIVQVVFTAHPGCVLPEAGDLVTVLSDRIGWDTARTVRILAIQRSIGEGEELPGIRIAARVHDAAAYGSKAAIGVIQPAPKPAPNPNAHGFGSPGNTGSTRTGGSATIRVGNLGARVRTSNS